MGAAVSTLSIDDDVVTSCLQHSRGELDALVPIEVSSLLDEPILDEEEEEEGDSRLHTLISLDCSLNLQTEGPAASLAPLAFYLARPSTAGLALSNNSITPELFSTLPPLTNLTYLQCGGNDVALSTIVSAFGAARNRVLDVSFTESLGHEIASIVKTSPFSSSSHLMRLVLDGIALESTLLINNSSSTVDSGHNCGSVFEGLTSLMELSLKGNLLPSVDSLQGIEVLGSTLTRLCLDGNPVTEINANLVQIRSLLCQFPQFVYLDGKSVRATDTGGGGVVLTRIEGGSSAIGVLSGPGLDQMEKEYLAALRQEKDVSVIS